MSLKLTWSDGHSDDDVWWSRGKCKTCQLSLTKCLTLCRALSHFPEQTISDNDSIPKDDDFILFCNLYLFTLFPHYSAGSLLYLLPVSFALWKYYCKCTHLNRISCRENYYARKTNAMRPNCRRSYEALLCNPIQLELKKYTKELFPIVNRDR